VVVCSSEASAAALTSDTMLCSPNGL
jgi:hypothetical protein